jgi:DNA-binding protein YbaB
MSTWGDTESSIATIREQMAATLARAEQAQGLKDQIARVRATSTSPRREVTVVVDASGRLVDVTFSADATNLSPDELSKEVLAAVARAQREAGDQAIALTADIFGEDSETVAMLRSEVDERMPDLPADDSVGYP